MAKRSYEKEIKLLDTLVEKETDHDIREGLRIIREILSWSGKEPPTLSFRHGDHWYIGFAGVGDDAVSGFNVDAPYLEEGHDDRARIVIGFHKGLAQCIRQNFNIPIQPMALDATEAMVRATHALAGAAIEMTHVAKKFLEKK